MEIHEQVKLTSQCLNFEITSNIVAYKLKSDFEQEESAFRKHFIAICTEIFDSEAPFT